jgi:hypothetical protein
MQDDAQDALQDLEEPIKNDDFDLNMCTVLSWPYVHDDCQQTTCGSDFELRLDLGKSAANLLAQPRKYMPRRTFKMTATSACTWVFLQVFLMVPQLTLHYVKYIPAVVEAYTITVSEANEMVLLSKGKLVVVCATLRTEE